MKTLMPVAVGATCLGLLSPSCQIDGFVISVPSRTMQDACSSWDARGLLRRRAASCRATCRMGGEGFGQAQGSEETSKGKEAAEAKESKLKTTVGGDESTKKGTGSRNLFLQFTCNQCEGVSQFLINKNAYTDGIVICTCQTCQVKHLLADNLKKMDTPELGNNIEDYMQSVGRSDEVTKGIAPGITPEIMEKYDISLGKDGVLNLSPKVPKAE